MRFADRQEAGRKLAARLTHLADRDPLVLGLPRGGVPVAAEVASSLGAELDIWVVRKVGAPHFEEFGIGAVAEGGVVYLDHASVAEVGVGAQELERLVMRRASEVAARAYKLRQGRPPPEVRGRTVIVIDDGIATGGSMHAALQSLRQQHPAHLVLATPLAASQSLAQLEGLADEVVCVHATPALSAIGAWYDDFHQVPEEDVSRLLEASRAGVAPAADASPAPGGRAARGETEFRATERELSIPVPGGELDATLVTPGRSLGLVVFAHGSGSSRLSVRNRQVAATLNRHGLATLLVDLLTPEEEQFDAVTGSLRFDIPFLARRLVSITGWARSAASGVASLPLGYFGSSTGAAAALIAAAERPSEVAAVVSRGGRPDLAASHLANVRAPTLLIVGGADDVVLELNARAEAMLQAPHALDIVPGATHLFEEPGTLEAVAELAARWFERHLGGAREAGRDAEL